VTAPLSRSTVLVTDDDPLRRGALQDLLESGGFAVEAAESGLEALARIATAPPALVVLDQRMPGLSGVETLRRLKQSAPWLPVVMLTAHPTMSLAVDALRLGASEVLPWPLDDHWRLVRIAQGLLARRTPEPGTYLSRLASTATPMRRVVEQVRCVAASRFTVLIQGETGTGKELVARAIHDGAFPDGERPFVALDCGATSETLFEDELFGHEQGAFTGARHARTGTVRLAEGGTLFLDEVSNLPLPLQTRLLRVLQERVVRPVGADHTEPANLRVVAATNEPLDALVAAGRMRRDLYFRLAEFTIDVPPLRERRSDIPALASTFLAEVAAELGRPPCELSHSAMTTLMAREWRGNVRELRNVVRQVALVSAGILVDVELLAHILSPTDGRPSSAPPAPAPDRLPEGLTLRETVDGATRVAIVQALRLAGGCKTRAARLLDVDFKTLSTKMERLAIDAAAFAPPREGR
jgi:DNA-binding NtrC family response regulator